MEAALMKTREVTLITGESFTVPQGVQRLDAKSTHGWQVRYQGTKYFADGSEGPKKSLDKAVRELFRRVASMPAPVPLKNVRSSRKTSELPVGISGPIVLTKSSERQLAVLSVVMPRFGRPNEIREVHIGTPSTYTKARYLAAVGKAVALRQESVAQYEQEATRARRKAAVELRKVLAAAA
jgi:hypothetical protein